MYPFSNLDYDERKAPMEDCQLQNTLTLVRYVSLLKLSKSNARPFV